MFWFKGKQVKELPPKVTAYRKSFQAIVDEALKREPVRDYNDLIPPSNPDYDWQTPLCYYCAQPLERIGDKYVAGERQRVYSEFGWYHLGGEYRCKLELIRPGIDLPRCHICHVQVPPHGDFCSAAGYPPLKATTMDYKEAEVQQWAERERGEEMHNALYALLQEYEVASNPNPVALRGAVRRVLKASPWGHAVK